MRVADTRCIVNYTYVVDYIVKEQDIATVHVRICV